MKRRKTRLKLARKRAEKRLAKTDVLKRRARRGARSQFADKLAGKGKSKGDVSVAKKKQIEKRLKPRRLAAAHCNSTKKNAT